MSKSWAAGSTSKWRRTRRQVLLRNQTEHNGQCEMKIPNVCTGAADTVHHLLGRAVTGDDPQWLVGTCAACNLAIGDPTARPTDPPPRRMTQW